ncbi:MAG: metal ABC transporter ATP-binding protein [bacterium]|nr:metal ABC transporter ATP-binding protein [bacterium]
MEPVIQVSNLCVSYGQSEAVRNVSFSIAKGDYVGLAGPNGSGKSTLVKALLGLAPWQKGEILLLGEKQKKFSSWQKIGYLPQRLTNVNPLFPASVEEVVLLGLLSKKKMPKIITKSDRKKAERMLKELEIGDLKDNAFAELSGGQQQRVVLARCLVADPEILIFDEPSTALDPESRDAFFAMIKKLNKEKGITIVLITHDVSHLGRFANKLMYLDKKLIYFGTFEDFCQSEKMLAYFGHHGQHMICHQHAHHREEHK